MYTEEQEFDYNEYLEENGNNNGSFFDKKMILKIILLVLLVILAIFLVFKVQNNNSNKNNTNNNQNSDNYLLVFNSNIESLRSASYTYFFQEERYPETIGEVVSININDLREVGLITEITDSDGSSCGYNTSTITLTRNANDYEEEIYLLCPSITNSVIYYYDLDFNCLNCNGEDYIPSSDDESNLPTDDETNNTDDNQSDTDNNQETDENTELVCQDFTDWTTQYIADSSLDRESRVVVIGYKENISYGEWSTPSTVAITSSDTLEVKTEVKAETTTTTSNWSSESTTKPSSKEGREISSRQVKKTYTTQSCTGGTTYTKETKYWDSEATRCVATAIGKFTCTYTTEKVCKDVKKTKTTTYYKYRDTITTTNNVTYYSSRQITKTVDYTDYILESEMPTGYQKVAGSEITQYRYRTKCNLK